MRAHLERAPARLVDDPARVDDLVVLVHPRELGRRLRRRLARQVRHARDETVELALLLRRPLGLICGEKQDTWSMNHYGIFYSTITTYEYELVVQAISMSQKL